MEIIPLITLEKRMILDTNQKTTEAKEIKKINENNKIYILDKDGIEKDKPNLCLFQKISGNYSLWIDSQPVELGDVVDSFMAGATTITIRKNLLKKTDIEKIREITENEIFYEVDLQDIDELKQNNKILNDVNGIVIFNSKDFIESNPRYAGFLKELCKINKTYAYETNLENIFFWVEKGITGLLVDINRVEEFKKKWQMMQK